MKVYSVPKFGGDDALLRCGSSAQTLETRLFSNYHAELHRFCSNGVNVGISRMSQNIREYWGDPTLDVVAWLTRKDTLLLHWRAELVVLGQTV